MLKMVPVPLSPAPFSRLPTSVVPIHYGLRLQPDLEKFTFQGFESVQLEIREESTTILLNAAELTINHIEWEDGVTKNLQKSKEFTLNEKDELLTIEFEPPLPVGNGTLKITFDGILNDQLKGFYRSKYKGPNGDDRYNAVTQFASTDARRSFPCWDEPAVKATFDVTLIVPKGRVALSNMPVKAITPHDSDPKLQVIEFDTTPKMSTYLLAYCVGEFDYLEDTSSDGVLCRVYTQVGKKEQGRFALNITTKVLPFYNEYFGIDYPLPKLDLIAIADFAYGAMENWGLITYRETCLLVDEKESSAINKQRVALTVGHEIAHQWFGNLVTMEWWTHLWLNEGYATFVQFLCVDHLFPEYDIWTQFVTDTHNLALELDCLNSSHPIEVPVSHYSHPSEIQEIFDDISYAKGAAIIRMLHDFIGDDAFRRGMNIYLNRHKYNNTVTNDLWKALEEASFKRVREVMSTWTKQMGFPIVKLEDVRRRENLASFKVNQEKFWADLAFQTDEDANRYWLVPLTVTTGKDPTRIVRGKLLDTKLSPVTVEVDDDDWFKLNPGIKGFYRVSYSSEMMKEFITPIRTKSMPPLDRLGLLDDLFALVKTGQGPTVEVLEFLQAYVDEDNYTVWANINDIINKLNLLMGYSNYHERFKSFGRELFSKVLQHVGWESKGNESHLQTMLRSLVLNRMSALDHENTLWEANKRFALHISGERPVPADLRTAVYASALASVNVDTLKIMLKMYRDSDNQEERARIARSLGASKDLGILKQVLEFAISDEVRSQDTVNFFIHVGAGSKDGRDLAWNFFKEHHEFFQQKYPKGFMVGKLVKHLAENFVSEEKALEIETFFQEHSFYSTERAVQQAVESIRLNETWLKRDLQSIENYLREREEMIPN